MDKIINFIISNFEGFSVIFSSVVLAATTIIKITPSTKDDFIWDKIISFIEKLSLINTKDNQKILDRVKNKYK